jgi:Topoisomerase IA
VSAVFRRSTRATRCPPRRSRSTGTPPTPPARYTEASLVKELEEREIGRPSTYASIIGTILDRGYVFKKGTALVPSFLSFAVVNLLEKHFGRLVDYDFTAKMEDDLDRIARGEAQAVPWLKRFYFGEGDAAGAAEAGNGDGDHLGGLKELVTDLGAIDAPRGVVLPGRRRHHAACGPLRSVHRAR